MVDAERADGTINVIDRLIIITRQGSSRLAIICLMGIDFAAGVPWLGRLYELLIMLLSC